MAGEPYPLYSFRKDIDELMDLNSDVTDGLHELRLRINSVKKLWSPPVSNAVKVWSPFNRKIGSSIQLPDPHPWQPLSEEEVLFYRYQGKSGNADYPPLHNVGRVISSGAVIKLKKSCTIEKANQMFRELVTRVLLEAEIQLQKRPFKFPVETSPESSSESVNLATFGSTSSNGENFFIEVQEIPHGWYVDSSSSRAEKRASTMDVENKMYGDWSIACKYAEDYDDFDVAEQLTGPTYGSDDVIKNYYGFDDFVMKSYGSEDLPKKESDKEGTVSDSLVGQECPKKSSGSEDLPKKDYDKEGTVSDNLVSQECPKKSSGSEDLPKKDPDKEGTGSENLVGQDYPKTSSGSEDLPKKDSDKGDKEGTEFDNLVSQDFPKKSSGSDESPQKDVTMKGPGSITGAKKDSTKKGTGCNEIKKTNSKKQDEHNKQPQITFLKPDDVLAYPSGNIQHVFAECNFVIQVLKMQKNIQSSQLISMFTAKVLDPIGFEHDTYVKTVPMMRNSIFGSFYPLMPGYYFVSVYLKDGNAQGVRQHVMGSPFTITVARNYALETGRVNVRIGLEGLLDSGHNESRCWGITSDRLTDNTYVSNREKHEIAACNILGLFMFKFGQQGSHFVSTRENLFRPTGICCDSFNRRLLVADKDNHRIAIYSLDGGFITSFGKMGHQDGQFNFPWDVDCTGNGDRIVVTDSKNHRIQLFDRFGRFLNKFSAFESNPFNYKSVMDNPRGVTFDKEGKKIYFTDFSQDTVTCINAELTNLSKFHINKSFGRLQGLSVDDVGNVLVCDTRRNLIRVIDPAGQLITSFGSLESVPLHQPLNITVMRGGNVAVLDHNGRVRIF